MPIFALTKKGLVAQLNSALDYGSRGYWFESSQGHKTPADVGVFLWLYLSILATFPLVLPI